MPKNFLIVITVIEIKVIEYQCSDVHMTVKGIYNFVGIVAADATPNFGATAIRTSRDRS